MAEFKIKLKLTGLEIEIEGSHEDLPMITQNITEQFSGLLNPATAIVEGETISQHKSIVDNPSPPQSNGGNRKKTKRRTATVVENANSEESHAALAWRHDDNKYGMPKQEWKVLDKFLWLLYVLHESQNITEYTAKGLANTFNKQFRQAGLINVKNATRDIGTLKTKTPALVGEDTTQTPSKWFLTEAGTKEAHKLIASAKGIEAK